MRGRPGDDALDGGPGNDIMWPGRGTDTQNGGDGDDILHALARDHQVDTIDCGAGNDIVVLNAKETTDVHVNCETVKTVTVRRRLATPKSPLPQHAAAGGSVPGRGDSLVRGKPPTRIRADSACIAAYTPGLCGAGEGEMTCTSLRAAPVRLSASLEATPQDHR